MPELILNAELLSVKFGESSPRSNVVGATYHVGWMIVDGVLDPLRGQASSCSPEHPGSPSDLSCGIVASVSVFVA